MRLILPAITLPPLIQNVCNHGKDKHLINANGESNSVLLGKFRLIVPDVPRFIQN